jgi:hypothetical protein
MNNNNNLNEKNKEDDFNKEKLKKSMFASDFLLLSLQQALEIDNPINFNVEKSSKNNLNNINHMVYKKLKKERFKSYKSINRECNSGLDNKNDESRNEFGNNCIVEIEAIEENCENS